MDWIEVHSIGTEDPVCEGPIDIRVAALAEAVAITRCGSSKIVGLFCAGR